MKKTLILGLFAALLFGLLVGPFQATAQDVKPLAVVSIAGYDELLADAEFAGSLSDRPDLAKGVEAILKLATKGKGLAGLDKSRPSGILVGTDGTHVGGCAFLPVTDLEQLLEVLKPYLGKIEQGDGGVIEVHTKGKTVYLQQKGRWAYIAEKPEILAHAPKDPTPWLAGLSGRYDLALRLHVANVPQQHRRKVAEHLKEHAQKHFRRHRGETDEQFAVRKKLAGQVLKQVLGALDDLEQVTVGWSLDRSAAKAQLEITVTAKPGSATAGKFAEIAQTKSRFSGFHLPGAAVTWGGAGNFRPPSEKDLGVLFDAVRQRGKKKFGGKELPEAKAKVARRFAAGILDVCQATIATGRADGAASIVLNPEGATFVVGRNVADGTQLEKVLGQVVKAVRRKYPDRVEQVLTVNADECKGVRMHRLSLPIPDKCKDREKAVRLVGEKLEVVLGIGPEAMYLAAGRDAAKTLKRAIEQSEAASSKTVPPLQCSLDLGEIAEFMAAVGKPKQQQKARQAVELLKKSAGRDHIRFTAVPVPRGLRLQLQFDEGVLRVIGAMRKKK